MRKSILIFGIILCSISYELNAQNTSEGIFLSSGDFVKGKLSYVNNHNNEKYKIYLHTIFNTSKIVVSIGDSDYTFYKNAIFGYRDKNNISYRFYKNDAYRIINPKEGILLYSTYTSVNAPKNVHTETRYFFSMNANAPIYKLTKENIKAVFINEVSFNELLDVYFHSDSELTTYDNTDKMYQLNRVYELSQQKKITADK